MKFGPYGGAGGNPWKENVFSKIKAFVIYHQEWIFALQIYYEKNGESISSPLHGGDGGSRSEVSPKLFKDNNLKDGINLIEVVMCNYNCRLFLIIRMNISFQFVAIVVT